MKSKKAKIIPGTKQVVRFTHYGVLPDLNTEIKKKGGARHGIAYSSWKRTVEENISLSIKSQLPGVKIKDRFAMIFRWYSKDKRKDQDNIEFAKKYLLDAMQGSGMIKNDGWKQAGGNTLHEHYIDKTCPRVEVILLTNRILKIEV